MRAKPRYFLMEKLCIVMVTVLNNNIEYIFEEIAIRVFVSIGVILLNFLILGLMELEGNLVIISLDCINAGQLSQPTAVDNLKQGSEDIAFYYSSLSLLWEHFSDYAGYLWLVAVVDGFLEVVDCDCRKRKCALCILYFVRLCLVYVQFVRHLIMALCYLQQEHIKVAESFKLFPFFDQNPDKIIVFHTFL